MVEGTFDPAALGTVAGIAGLVWVVVEVAKRAGAPLGGRVTVAVALLTGLALGGASLLWATAPVTARMVATALLTGLLGGAAAMGVDAAGRSAAGSEV